jgi:hypothetical protein
MSSSSQSAGPLSHVIDQWFLWVAALITAGLAIFLSTQVYGTFNAIWFGILTVLIVLYAVRNTATATWVLERLGW